ncbi:MAG: ZIP family metal transporter [Defluviitaleaceae bacterium]|nr:ZIP family metal transporter [Defluviitaleaceae bacterium]
MEILALTALAGIVGMGLGGLVSGLLGNVSPKVMCWMLSFAGGVMVSVVCFELIPESVELGGMNMAMLGLIIGVLIVLFLNQIVDKFTINDRDSFEKHMTKAGLYHENKLIANPALLRSGIIMLIAIGLHNLPEGMAIGAAGVHDMQLGMMLAFIIMLHCIPEGMAVASPLIAGGVSKKKAVTLTALSGAPTILGGAIGMFIGSISDGALALALASAGGAMLYVVFGEILPQSTIQAKSRFTSLAALLGILVGLLITSIHY